MSRRPFWIALLLVWSLGPMLWQLVSSFTTADALVNDQLSFWNRWTLNNYRDLLGTDPPFGGTCSTAAWWPPSPPCSPW